MAIDGLEYSTMVQSIRIATRKSPLALRQTELVDAWLKSKLPEDHYEMLQLTTQVDERLSWSLEKRGGIGLFTKELEAALLEGKATLAVHSAKDMPTTAYRGSVHRRLPPSCACA
jgi:hydroxymethylbilane synthase